MKHLIKHYAINTYSLYLASNIASGMSFEAGIKTLLFAGLGLTTITVFAKPVINLLLLPLNMVTYGMFRWVYSAIALFLVELIIPGFKVLNFSYNGFSNAWFDIPALNFDNWIAYIAFAFILSLITSVVYWVIK